MTCPRCNEPVRAGALICTACGEILGATAYGPAAVPGDGRPAPGGTGADPGAGADAGAGADPGTGTGPGAADNTTGPDGQVPSPATGGPAGEESCANCGATRQDKRPICSSCLRPFTRVDPPGLETASGHRIPVPPGGQLPLGRDPGRSPIADVFAARDNVSRHHATVGTGPDGGLWVRDEGSTNGTFVNDQRVPAGESVPIRDGDALRLASTESFTVRG